MTLFINTSVWSLALRRNAPSDAPVVTGLRRALAGGEIRNECRRHGVQLGTIDALIAALCLSRETTLLTTDRDFVHAARHIPLRLWRPV